MKLIHCLGLNVRIIKGIVGKLFFQVPWTKIWKEPCHVVVENVHILCSLASKYNHEGIKEMLVEDKLSRLKEIEENEVYYLGYCLVYMCYREKCCQRPRIIQQKPN